MLENTKRYLAECGDLEAKMEELESRIAALESNDAPETVDSDVPSERAFVLFNDEETCPECGNDPCTCEECDEDEVGCIDEEDVDEIEELDFSKPHFLSDDEEDDEEPEADGGLYPYDDDEEEDGPYYR